MTTEEAIKALEGLRVDWAYADDLVEATEAIKAALARVTAERDRLIEAWPCRDKDTVYRDLNGKWAVSRGWSTFANCDPCYDTREAAVRAAAGLDAGEGV